MSPEIEAHDPAAARSRSTSSAWAPFRSAAFRSMAVAQFVSNIGSWMQTVGAQELMLTLTSSATLVALIQTASGLPVVLLAVPAGALGDLVDRRRLLILAQCAERSRAARLGDALGHRSRRTRAGSGLAGTCRAREARRPARRAGDCCVPYVSITHPSACAEGLPLECGV